MVSTTEGGEFVTAVVALLAHWIGHPVLLEIRVLVRLQPLSNIIVCLYSRCLYDNNKNLRCFSWRLNCWCAWAHSADYDRRLCRRRERWNSDWCLRNPRKIKIRFQISSAGKFVIYGIGRRCIRVVFDQVFQLPDHHLWHRCGVPTLGHIPGLTAPVLDTCGPKL